MKTIVTFTNLFPSSAMPGHGTFVEERMRRVAEASGLLWRVVAPVPAVIWPLRHGIHRRWHEVPPAERWQGVQVAHPRYRHWPGLSMRGQADAMARGARPVVAELARRGPIVLDAHYAWPDGVAASVLARELSVPFAITARGSDLNVLAKDPVVRRRIAESAGRADGLFAVSAALCDRFAQVASLPRDRIVEVRNGVDLERFRPGDAAAARAALGLPATGRLLLGVGRLVPGKGFALAARALGELPADVGLVLVGEGPERAAIARRGGGRVTFLGQRAADEVALCYRACDLLVLPSAREGWPNVITEALASGLRVVATDVGGIPEILAHPGRAVGPLGALVPPGDESALSTALSTALATPGDRDHVRGFAERYGWRQPVEFLSAFYRRALGESAA